MSIRKEYLNRKSKRHGIEGESVTEENRKNSNSNNKTEEELSTPINLEKSSSTSSNENKVQESQNRLLSDYLNKKFEFFQKQIDDLKEQNRKQERKIETLKEQNRKQERNIETLNSQVKELNEFYLQVNIENY